MPFAEDQDVIQAVPPQCPDQYVCEGGPRRRTMYLETVHSATSKPSFSNSP